MSTTSTTTGGEMVTLLRRATQWRLAGLLFEPPAGCWSQQVAALREEVDDPLLERAAARALEQAAEPLYHTLFGPGSTVSLREVAYRPMVEPGHLLAELGELYEVFGYHPNLVETPDHLAVEAGFVAYLRVKEAFALHCGETEKAAMTTQVIRHFCSRHLAFATAPLAKSLKELGVEYLTLAAEAISRRIEQLCGSPPGTPG